ncbi:MAG: virulence-associated E family protein [Bacteroidetes bacterium]|nr:virulence-associated E family protein [Bacteroidota bacterium]
MQSTIFKNFIEVVEQQPITSILADIKNGKYKNGITYLRKSLAENKTDAYDKGKKSLLAFTPSASFVCGRKLEFVKDYTGILILDIDKLTQEQLKQTSFKANQCEYTFASFISPSGNGLKILVKVNSDKANHKEAFLKVQAFYEALLGLQIDKSGKDVTRLCFYSYDSELYLNEAATVFQVVCKEDLTEYIQPFIETKIETQPVNNFEVVYQHCIKFTEKKVQYTSGSRNTFVHQLACNLNRKAVPLQVALGYILADYNFDEKEVTQAVNSAYGNLSEYGKSNATKDLSNKSVNENGEINITNDDEDEDKPKPTIIDRLETFLSNKYIFRHNIVSGKLEFQYFGKKKWNVMNDFIENSMLRECLKARIKTNLSSLRSLLYSDFCQLYNPFEDYFETLPEYDLQTDYITQLANTITTTKQDLWQQCFKKWLVAMVGCVLNDKVINHTVIVFSGKQGLGKTTWVEKLVPKQLKEYLFSGTINPNNKDTLVQLAECMLINLDELENLNRSEIGSLKEIITKTQIRMRKAYGHNNETMPRRASFAGSVNTAQFLNDSTGSRRFLCFEVEGIQYQHDVDINLVYAQALHLFNDGFRFWFDQEEIKSITENNEQYQLRSPEEELLLTWFEPCTKETATSFLNASQIAAKLAERTKLTLTDGTINKIGKSLKKHKFIRLIRQGSPVYAVKEFSWDEVETRNKKAEE